MRLKPVSFASGLAIGMALANAATAQYAIDWHSLDCGGAMSTTGGAYTLSGAIGQPDAGTMSGGGFELVGGFWAVVTPSGTGVPAAAVTAAVSRKNCDISLLPGTKSEPRLGGITELRIAFDLAPGGPGNNPVTLEEAVCPAPSAYGPYTGSSVLSASVEGAELVLIFTPGLENGRTYRLTVGPEVTALPGQIIEVRSLIGDVNSSGRVNGGDRSAVVSAWTGPDNFSCATDLDGNGRTHAPDRSIVVGAWTGVGHTL